MARFTTPGKCSVGDRKLNTVTQFIPTEPEMDPCNYVMVGWLGVSYVSLSEGWYHTAGIIRLVLYRAKHAPFTWPGGNSALGPIPCPAPRSGQAVLTRPPAIFGTALASALTDPGYAVRARDDDRGGKAHVRSEHRHYPRSHCNGEPARLVLTRG